MTDDLKALSDAATASSREMAIELGNRFGVKALVEIWERHQTDVQAWAKAVNAEHVAAIEAARAEEREVWALAAQDIADSNHSYEAAKQFSRFARALRAGGEQEGEGA